MYKLTKSRLLNLFIAFSLMLGLFTAPTINAKAESNSFIEIFYEGFSGTKSSIIVSDGWDIGEKLAGYDSNGNYGEESPSAKLDGTGKYIESPSFNIKNDGTLSFWIKAQSGFAQSELYVKALNNDNWDTLETLSLENGKLEVNKSKIVEIVIPKEYSKIKLEYKKGSSNVAIDDIRLVVSDDGEINPPVTDGTITIEEARQSSELVKVKGIVTFKESTGEKYNYAIQDSTAAIAIRGIDELEIGDEVIVEGNVTDYRALAQIEYTALEKKASGNTLPNVKEVTISDIIDNGENYESQRIKISNVTIGEIKSSGNTVITDNTGKTINIFKAPELIGIKEGDKVDVVGICSQYNSYQVRVASASDVVKVDEVEPPVVEDKEGPTVINVYPKSNGNIGENRRPEISAEFEDEAEVDMYSVKMYLDDVDVSLDLLKEDNKVKYNVKEDLIDGKHNVKITVKDTLGNETAKEWSFRVGEIGDLNFYFGQLHSHTTLSDGQGTVEQAYTYARDNAELDFFAVTDHSNWFKNDTQANISDGSMSETWITGLNAAEKYNKDGEFAAFYGYEMTWSGGTGGYGHINTFNTPGFETRSNKNMNLKTYYETLKTQPQSLSQLNHPGKTFGDFTDFAHYDEEIDELITLIEVGNGEGAVRGSGYFPSYEYYTRALDKGWHVAPTNNQDNHKGLWGNSNTARTVALAPELDRESIYDAIRERRVYSTEDENLMINYTLNGEVMGTIVEDTPEKVNIKVEIEDEDTTDIIGEVSVIANGGVVVDSKYLDSSKGQVEFELDSNYSYYYIKVVQADKDIAVTAPVWVGEVEKAGISKTEANTTMPLKDEEITITTELFNNEESPLEFSEIEYSIDGEVIHKTTEKITINSLATNSYKFNYTPTKAGGFNIDVKGTATIGGVTKTYTDVLQINVADPKVTTKVIIDGTHHNDYVNGYYAKNINNFTSIANGEDVSVKVETENITEEMLEDTQLLIISAPAKKSGTSNGVSYVPMTFSDEFINMVKGYVNNGGNIVVCGIADYQDGTGEYASSTQLNKLLEAIGATSRINNDEVVDDAINSGQAYRLALTNYNMNSKVLEGIDENQIYSFYSGCSVSIDADAYKEGKVEWLVRGHDTTYSFDSNKNTTGVAVPQGEVIALAEETLSGGGKMYIGGTVFISDFEVKADLDNAGSLQNSNYNIVLNILDDIKKEVPITPIKDVVNAEEGEVFVIEGIATSGTLEGNAFFDCIYIQDETAGINLFPISNTTIEPGQKLRVVGSVSSYEGERQLKVSSFEVVDTTVNPLVATKMSTEDAMKAENVGTLIEVTGIITDVVIKNDVIESFLIKDSSEKEARVFINGYIGYSDSDSEKLENFIKVGANLTAVGLGSVDTEGARLRVRDRSEIKLSIEETSNVEINILHTNDSHGRVVADNKVIGIDTIAAIKASLKNALLVDAGDTLHGLPFATMNRGKDIVELMKMAGYDLMAPGNHDFNYGYEELLELAKLSAEGENGFEIISANVLKESGLLFKSMRTILNANSIKEIDGVKIGFFGLTSPETTYKTNPNNVNGLVFSDPIETAKEQVRELKAAGADIVIALAHIGDDESTEVKSTDIAKAVPGIDVIIDGHSHSKYENGLQVGNTLIVSAGEYEANLGKLTLVVNSETKEITKKEASLINKVATNEYTPDSEVTAKINEIKAAQDVILSEKIGITVTKLDGARELVRTGETNLGNLVTDSMLNTTGAQIAITNGGGIRANIEAGDITKGNVIEVLPFGNFVVTKKLTGAQIKDVLEHGIKDAPNAAGQFPHVAGISFVYNPEQEVGNRIVSITFNGRPLEMDKEYLVATNDFISAGGDGYPHFSSIKTENEFCALDEALADYVKLLGIVDYKIENRILTQAQDDVLKAGAVIKQMDELPEIITLDHKDAVVAARRAYEALTDAQKALITNLSKLEEAEQTVVELEEAKAEAEANNRVAAEVIAKIELLPEVITLLDKEAIVEARKAYEALTDAQKALVTNLSKLEEAEQTIEDLEKEEDKDNDEDKDNSNDVPEEKPDNKPSTSVKPDSDSTNSGSGNGLPQTGGTNTVIIIIVALIIVGIGAVIILKNRRKEVK